MTSRQPTSHEGLEWTVAQARQTAHQMLEQVGLGAAELKLLRFGNNGVFQVEQDAVIRVARPTTPTESTQREVQAARVLAEADVPVVRLADLPAEQPLAADGCLGTVWNYVAGQRPTFRQFGRLVRQFHERSDGLSLQLPEWRPLATARQRLDVLANQYSEEDISLLNTCYASILDELDDLEPVLPHGVIHGQAELGNTLMRGETPLFLDFERVCTGLREWDLIDTAVTVLRFDRPREDYQHFADAYGFDVMRWDGFAVLRRVWELRATTWLMQTKKHSDAHADEVRLRIDSWRDDEPVKVWRGF